jgi:hypothetical protein
MESYFKGRAKTQRFHVAIPTQKNAPKKASDKNEDSASKDETVVTASVSPAVKNAPQVDLVMKNGEVSRIVIHLDDGRKLELDCVYEEEP